MAMLLLSVPAKPAYRYGSVPCGYNVVSETDTSAKHMAKSWPNDMEYNLKTATLQFSRFKGAKQHICVIVTTT